jgi:hypothetical protein
VKKNPRSRQKSDPWWSGITKVTERTGLTTYSVFNGNKLSIRQIDHLKTVSLREEHLRHLRLNPIVKFEAERNFGKIGKCNLKFDNLEPNVSKTWRGKTVWIGYPGLNNMEAIVDKLRAGTFRVAYVILPEIECEPWYRKIDKLSAAKWHGCDPESRQSFWVDTSGKDCGTSVVCWWVIKVVGKSH